MTEAKDEAFTTIYRNHVITVAPDGQFVTVIEGNRVKKPSLTTLRGAIDKAHVKPFIPLKAVVIAEHRSDCGQVVTLVGVTTKRRFGGVRFLFNTAEGRRLDGSDLMLATPENRAALRAWKTARRKADKRIDAIRDDLAKLKSRIVAPNLADHIKTPR